MQCVCGTFCNTSAAGKTIGFPGLLIYNGLYSRTAGIRYTIKTSGALLRLKTHTEERDPFQQPGDPSNRTYNVTVRAVHKK